MLSKGIFLTFRVKTCLKDIMYSFGYFYFLVGGEVINKMEKEIALNREKK